MIQSILLFALGFLSAGFLALMIAPAVWRRAVTLTRRRIEASVPLTMNEIQADKDRLRAEFAMQARRLEMTVKELRDRTTSQLVETNRNREDLKRLAAERDERSRAAGEMEVRTATIRGDLARREEEVASLAARLDEAQKALHERQREIDRLGKLYEEVSFAASSRQIDLVARESELEKFTGDVSDLKSARREAERRAREAVAESKAANEALRLEKRRVAELEKQVERLEARHDRKASENENSGETQSGSPGISSAEREQLQDELEALRRENRELKDDHAQGRVAQERTSTLLREQMNELAAEVLNLTIRLDGPSSPIANALDAARPAGANTIPSLADRVRALREKASADASQVPGIKPSELMPNK
jgi:chromosome segregation ATPase